MAASSRGFSTAQFDFKLRARRLNVVAASLLLPSKHVLVDSSCSSRKRRKTCFFDVDRARLRCCCSDSVTPIRRASGAGNGGDRSEEWRLDPKKNPHIHRMRVKASPAAMPFASPPYVFR